MNKKGAMKLVVATGNPHKLEEFRRILSPLGIDTLSLAEVGGNCDVEETGSTFMENARIKAAYVYQTTGLSAVADDSGLCVDALDGRPGVHSARYQGENTPHSEKITALLAELEAVPDHRRTARFVSAICCVIDAQHTLECEESCEGKIGSCPRGDRGFGFDPVFYVEKEGKEQSFGELSGEDKDALSHRGKALRQYAQMMKNYLENEEPR